MKLLMIICLIFLFVVPLFASDYTVWNGIKIKTDPDLDQWSMLHFFGGTIMYGVHRVVFDISSFWSFVLVFGEGIFYEVWKDGLGNTIPLTGGKGDCAADLLGDVAFTAIGGGFGALLKMAFKINKMKVVPIKRGVTITVSFNL